MWCFYLQDKRGTVKQLYKGVVFLHDENESENCGYSCAKANICEKMDFSSDIFKGKVRLSWIKHFIFSRSYVFQI